MTDDELSYFGPSYEERFKKGQELDRELDVSQLRFEQFQHQPHKDYLGHVFRWGFASRFVSRSSVVLDVGCGQDLPFLRSLGGSNPNTVPARYVGVDLNRITDVPRRKWADVRGQFDLIEDWREVNLWYAPFSLVVCFEVYEHVSPKLALPLLRTIRRLTDDRSTILISTPVYCHSFKMARNHLNERTKAEFEDDLHRAGFKVLAQFGTFGNYRDFQKMLGEDERATYDEARKFYGDDVMGCYLAPRFPEASRNVVHVCAWEEAEEDECELKESVLA